MDGRTNPLKPYAFDTLNEVLLRVEETVNRLSEEAELNKLQQDAIIKPKDSVEPKPKLLSPHAADKTTVDELAGLHHALEGRVNTLETLNQARVDKVLTLEALNQARMDKLLSLQELSLQALNKALTNQPHPKDAVKPSNGNSANANANANANTNANANANVLVEDETTSTKPIACLRCDARFQLQSELVAHLYGSIGSPCEPNRVELSVEPMVSVRVLVPLPPRGSTEIFQAQFSVESPLSGPAIVEHVEWPCRRVQTPSEFDLDEAPAQAPRDMQADGGAPLGDGGGAHDGDHQDGAPRRAEAKKGDAESLADSGPDMWTPAPSSTTSSGTSTPVYDNWANKKLYGRSPEPFWKLDIHTTPAFSLPKAGDWKAATPAKLFEGGPDDGIPGSAGHHEDLTLGRILGYRKRCASQPMGIDDDWEAGVFLPSPDKMQMSTTDNGAPPPPPPSLNVERHGTSGRRDGSSLSGKHASKLHIMEDREPVGSLPRRDTTAAAEQAAMPVPCLALPPLPRLPPSPPPPRVRAPAAAPRAQVLPQRQLQRRRLRPGSGCRRPPVQSHDV